MPARQPHGVGLSVGEGRRPGEADEEEHLRGFKADELKERSLADVQLKIDDALPGIPAASSRIAETTTEALARRVSASGNSPAMGRPAASAMKTSVASTASVIQSMMR